MHLSASFRRRIMGFLALSAALHLGISTMVLKWWPRAKPQVVVHATKYYPLALYYPGGAHTKWTPEPPGRRHQTDYRRKT